MALFDTTNRTNLELKHDPDIALQPSGIFYQSYQSGIETSVFAGFVDDTSTTNRTNLELKQVTMECFFPEQNLPIVPIWN